MSVAMLPKYAPEGAYEGETPEETATRLHLEHNRPPMPPVRLTPSVPKEFPYALYREWAQEDRDSQELRIALSKGMSLDNPREARIIAMMIPPYDSCLAQNEQDRANKIAEGWATSPDQMKASKANLNRRMFEAAGHRNFEDRHLTGPAQAEMQAVDDAANDHVLDVPKVRQELQDQGVLPKARRGRPKKANA